MITYVGMDALTSTVWVVGFVGDVLFWASRNTPVQLRKRLARGTA